MRILGLLAAQTASGVASTVSMPGLSSGSALLD
jgi:hypothetical protein